MGKFENYLNRVENFFGAVAGLIVVASMVLVSIDVLSRRLLKQPLPGIYEAVEVSLTGIVYLGLSMVQQKRGHVAVDMATDWLPLRYRKLLEAIGVLIGLILCLILAWMGAQYAIDAYQTGNYTGSVVRIPMWPPRTLIVIGLLLMSVRLAVDFVNDMRVVVTNKESNPS